MESTYDIGLMWFRRDLRAHDNAALSRSLKAWLAKLDNSDLSCYPVSAHATALAERPQALRGEPPELESLGFESGHLRRLGIPTGASGGRQLFEDFTRRMSDYHRARDFPALEGPSYLSVHLRFGTASIRELAGRARALIGGG